MDNSNNSGRILLAVANPKQFLFAPFELAMMNIILALAIMIACIGLLGFTPFWAVLPMVGGHVLLIILGTRNPHLATTLRASGKYRMRRTNLIPVKTGVKYTP